MAIITLTTDMGHKDHYVATVKGAILKEMQNLHIVDISHDITLADLSEAAYILRNAYRHFPEKTIHLLGLNEEPDADNPYLGILCDGHYFIGVDNGIFSLIFDKVPDLIVELNLPFDNNALTFPLRDLFVKCACHLARGGTLEVIGTRRESFKQRSLFKSIPEENFLKGLVVHIDHYENVITDITYKSFVEYGRGRPFIIYLKRLLTEAENYTIRTLARSYSDVAISEKIAFFNSDGNLEIAINQGSAKRLMGFRMGDTIRIGFYD